MSSDSDFSAWLSTPLGWLFLMLLAVWGGLVHWWSAQKKGKPFSLVELICELSSSGFVGVITWLICTYLLEFSPPIRAIAVAWAGHQGTRTLFLWDRYVRDKLFKFAPEPYPSSPPAETPADDPDRS